VTSSAVSVEPRWPLPGGGSPFRSELEETPGVNGGVSVGGSMISHRDLQNVLLTGMFH
jgi:hypothetical protein